VSVTRTVINGRKVALIDTPGFNNTLRSDKDVLESVAQFLGPDVLLSGIIYLQPVDVNRVQGSEMKLLRLFENICGKDTFSKVVIVSTMWSEMKHPKQARGSVEERLNDIVFWKFMPDHGARHTEHHNSKSSAKKIIEMLLDSPKPMHLQLQAELLMNDAMLGLTSAGKYVMQCMDDSIDQLTAKLQDLKFKQTLPGADQTKLREGIEEITTRISGIAKDRNEIRISRVVRNPLLNFTLLINFQVTCTKTCAWLGLGVATASCALAAAPFSCAIM
jgi:hypothetical protein